MSPMFPEKSSPQEHPTGPWWGLALGYFLGVVAYVSVQMLFFARTFWAALIQGAFVIAVALGAVLWRVRRKSTVDPRK